MTDVQPNPDRDEDLETTTPQPDENPQQRENLRDQVQRQPGQDDAAPARVTARRAPAARTALGPAPDRSA